MKVESSSLILPYIALLTNLTFFFSLTPRYCNIITFNTNLRHHYTEIGKLAQAILLYKHKDNFIREVLTPAFTNMYTNNEAE